MELKNDGTLGESTWTDWRIGLAVKPKLRTHPYFGEIGIVRRINPPTAHSGESMYVELWSNTQEPVLLDELTDDWMTA